MKFSIITIFPDSIKPYLNSSILKRAQEKSLIKINFYNPRNFVKDRRKTVDDKPFGGGPGMVMKAPPIIKAVELSKSKIKNQKSKIILFSARGRQFNAKMAREWAKKYKHLILIAGHYEGIDERVPKILKAISYKLETVSIGPYILTGGELPAMVVIDAVSRHTPGVLGKEASLEEKHGSYPVYTRPEVLEYKGAKYRVPKILLSGDHKKINKWREGHGKMIK